MSEPLQKVEKAELEKRLTEASEMFAVLVNKEMSSIQSDIQRIMNVVQVGGMDKADKH